MRPHISQSVNPPDAVAAARISAAIASGFTDIIHTICHERMWTWDWAGRPPGAKPGFPNPPVPLPPLSQQRVVELSV